MRNQRTALGSLWYMDVAILYASFLYVDAKEVLIEGIRNVESFQTRLAAQRERDAKLIIKAESNCIYK